MTWSIRTRSGRRRAVWTAGRAHLLEERRVDGRALDAGEVQVGLEGVQLAAERVALRDDVHQPEVLAVEHDEPGARAEDRPPARVELAQRLRQPLALDAERHRGRLAAGHH